MRSPRFALVGLSVLVTVWAGTAPAGLAQTTSPATDAPSTPSAAPTVTLLDAGAKPRRELRYGAPAGTTQTFRLRTYSDIGQTIGGQTFMGGTPNVTFEISVTVAEVTPEGNRRVDYRYDDVEVLETTAADAQIAAGIAPIVGLTGSTLSNPTGEVLESTVSVPTDLGPAARQVAEQLNAQAGQITPPLPTPAVGKGARWRTTAAFSVNGIDVEQETVTTLTRMRDDEIVLTAETVQRAPRQTFTDPASSSEMELLTSKATGTSEVVLALDAAPYPVGGEASTVQRQRLRTEGGKRISQTARTYVFLNEPER